MVSGPIPPFSNLPIAAQNYQPSRFVISAIALGFTTIVTTSVNHNYVLNQLCRLIIPPTFGCRQLNESQGYVLSIPSSTQVELSINSSQNVDPFVLSSATTVAQILAIGDISNGFVSSTGVQIPSVTVPGAFINISA